MRRWEEGFLEFSSTFQPSPVPVLYLLVITVDANYGMWWAGCILRLWSWSVKTVWFTALWRHFNWIKHYNKRRSKHVHAQMKSDWVLLTVQLQDGVVDLALELPGALEGAGHPQSLVHGHSCDDVVPDVRGHLPLRQNGPDDQPHDANERQEETQQLDTGVGHR